MAMDTLKAIEVVVKVAQGEKIDKLYDIPYELVTQDSVKDYIK
ncbi:MAG: hypothetical protein PWP27_2121 [Clostridiales bacterium]|jgi:ABC-type sugar transport system substrate-binding protein|nr:hypothetical protein [Clostridiales bacterium]MDK2934311.1 hypothetical protein [Clostridiales bacterium]